MLNLSGPEGVAHMTSNMSKVLHDTQLRTGAA